MESPASAQPTESVTDPPAAPTESPAEATDQASGGGEPAAANQEAAEPAAEQAAQPQPADNPPPGKDVNPFPRRGDVEEFPKDLIWLNSRPLTKADLKGKFVLLDFWTYCCINCMHILPELKKLEQQFPNNLVVIGVHSAKFETEKQTDNIREAILRYEIVHPVINDDKHKLWESFGVSSWPSIYLIDPEGKFVGSNSGEFKANLVSNVLINAIPFYRRHKLLDEQPLKFALEANKEQDTPLRFPGKILADEKSNRLFISDSNHNRIVIASLDGKLQDVIGSGTIGKEDGDFQSASFNHPQGCALNGDTLYVADTENHSLRKVDLVAKMVSTIAGTGEQAPFANSFPGWDGNPNAAVARKRWVGTPAGMPLNSPWALWVHKKDLFIAMAGSHQIWKMTLDEKEIGPFAGNGREDIIDDARMPRAPFQGGAAFAQPSGLSSDGNWLYVADSEGSSIREVPLEGPPTREVKTLVGSSHLSAGRLFAFGDIDGPKARAKLQHCIEVAYVAGKVYVADTYNHKIKMVDAKTGDTKTFAGTGKPGTADSPAQFHEPAGLTHANGTLYVADTNNHLIRTIDIASGAVKTLTIVGLTAPGMQTGAIAGGAAPRGPISTSAPSKKPDFQGAAGERLEAITVKAVDGEVKLHVSLQLPTGWKINPLAPMSYWLDSPRESGPADRASFGRTKLEAPSAEFDVPVRVSGAGEDEIHVSLPFYYCQTKDEGICKIGAVVFKVPLKIESGGNAGPVALKHSVAE